MHPVLWRQGHFVQEATVIAAFTWLDEHDWPLETLPVPADKVHGDGACAPRRAAPSLRARTAVVGPEEADALAVSVRQADGLWGPLCWGLLVPFVWLHEEKKSHFTVIIWKCYYKNHIKAFDFYLLLTLTADLSSFAVKLISFTLRDFFCLILVLPKHGLRREGICSDVGD